MYSQNKTLDKVKTFADAFFKILLILIIAFPFFWMISTDHPSEQEPYKLYMLKLLAV